MPWRIFDRLTVSRVASWQHMIFDSVHNNSEALRFQAILENAAAYPKIARNPEVLGEVACVAPDQPRYIQHQLDVLSYTDEPERAKLALEAQIAVEFARIDL